MADVTKLSRPRATEILPTTQDQDVNSAGTLPLRAGAAIAAILLIGAAASQNLAHAWEIGAHHSPFRAAVLAAAALGATVLGPLCFVAAVRAVRSRVFGQAILAAALGTGCLLYASTSSLGFNAGARDRGAAELNQVRQQTEIARARFDAARAELSTLQGTARRIVDRRRELSTIMSTAAEDLRRLPPARAPDSQAAAVAFYLSAAGWTVDAGGVAPWLSLAMTAFLELAAALSLTIVAALGSPRVSRPVHALQTGPAEPHGTEPVDARTEVAGRIVDTLSKSGGRASASVRGLARLTGIPKSSVHVAITGLIAAGIVARAGSDLILLS